MVQDVNAPVSIAVIAVEMIAATADPERAAAEFEHTAVLLTEIGSVLLDGKGTVATVALEPDTDIPGAISRLDSILLDFEERSAPVRLRALLHYGTAFRARESNGSLAFKGSAVRSVARLLERSSLPAGLFVSTDFASFAATIKGALGFEIAASEGSEFAALVLASHRKVNANLLHSADPDLVAWLKRRLARDLGPFAAALVDNASHSTRTAKELAAAVGHEIVDPRDRRRFDADVFKYIESRGS